MAKADKETHDSCTAISSKLTTGGNPSGATPEQRLADMERQAGLLPGGADQDAREARLARLGRLWGMKVI